MDQKFAAAVESLHSSFEKLVTGPICVATALPRTARTKGVYLFSENGRHLYVGRSNDVRGRYARHCSAGATHRMAAFAFRLAREATGRTTASYRAGPESRTGLMEDPIFRQAFQDAKMRIRLMDFRFVEEADPMRQALLEIYCVVAMQTPYNDFDNH